MSKKKTVELHDKEYRLLKDRVGESFILKSGRSKNLLSFDEDLGFSRAIRHCPNERSIYLDEQSEFALVEPIIFQGGFLKVSYKNQATQNFLDAHPDNAKNGGNWFEEINDEQIAKESIEMDELIVEIKQTIRNKGNETDGIFALEMVAAVLMDSVVKASKMSKDELKRHIYKEVDNNPEYFVDENNNVNIFDDEGMQRKYLTLRAIKDGIIKKSPNNKSMLWVKDNKVIATAPQGLELVEYFSDYLSTEEGILVIEEIKRRS